MYLHKDKTFCFKKEKVFKTFCFFFLNFILIQKKTIVFRGDKKLLRLSYIEGIETNKKNSFPFRGKRGLVGRGYNF